MTTNLLELLPLAKKLNDANNALLEREAMLKQLSLLQIVSNVVTSDQISKLFQVDCRILPNVTSETALVTVSNTSDDLSFDPQFWSLMICFPSGQNTCWNFDKTFRVGDSEKFSGNFVPDYSLKTVFEIDIMLVFSMQRNEKAYTKAFLVRSFPGHILKFLSAGRRPFLQAQFNLRISDVSVPSNYPLLSKFSICICEKFRATFLETVVLNNVEISRGFDVVSDTKTFQTTGSFTAYFYEEKITITAEKDCCIFRCSNPKILRCVKESVYSRLQTLCQRGLVKIKPIKDRTTEVAQKLYETNLNLQALSSTFENDFAQLLGFYQGLREETESLIHFTIIEEIE